MALTRAQQILLLLIIKCRMWAKGKRWRQKQIQRKHFYRRVVYPLLHHHHIGKFKRAAMLDMSRLLCLDICKPRSFCAYDRSELWFADMWSNRFDTEYQGGRFKRDFRMEGEIFDTLVNELSPLLRKQDTTFRRAIPVEKRVAIGVWRLATGNAFRTVAKTFGVGDSTAVEITHEFCSALVSLKNQYIYFPRNAVEVGEAIEKFKEDVDCKIPQAFCAVDGTLVEIVAPDTESKIDYYARTRRYAVNTQGIVGANLLFFHVATGYPGSLHDARVWRNTQVYSKIESGEILKYPEEIVENFRIKPLILGDGAYPLSTNLMKPYPFSNQLSREEEKINRTLSSSRVTVERAFGILKARYRTLLKRLDSHITNVSDVIIACAVLHNFCQMANDQYIDDDSVLQELLRKEQVARNAKRQNNTILGDAGGIAML